MKPHGKPAMNGAYHDPPGPPIDGYESQPRTWAEIGERRADLARQLYLDGLRRTLRAGDA